MRRAFSFPLLALVLLCLGAFVLLGGCGSSDNSEYEQEVSEINRITSEKLEESLHLLGEEENAEEEAHAEVAAEGEEEGHAEVAAEGEEEGHAEVAAEGEEEGQIELVVKGLEEAVIILKEALLELERIKVPAGMEDFHRQLTAFYQANLTAYEGYISTLEPGSGEAEGHGEEEGTETLEEEAGHEEETPQGEEAPPEEEAPAESSGH